MHRPTPRPAYSAYRSARRCVSWHSVPTRTKLNKTPHVPSTCCGMMCVSSGHLCRAGRVEGAAGLREIPTRMNSCPEITQSRWHHHDAARPAAGLRSDRTQRCVGTCSGARSARPCPAVHWHGTRFAYPATAQSRRPLSSEPALTEAGTGTVAHGQTGRHWHAAADRSG